MAAPASSLVARKVENYERLDKNLEQHHDHDGGRDRDQRYAADLKRADRNREARQDVGHRLGVRLENELKKVLQQHAHTNRRDEQRNARRVLVEKTLIRHLLDDNTDNGAEQHRREDRGPKRRSGQNQHNVRRVRTDHDDVAVREIDELRDAVDHAVAERDQSKNTALAQAVDDLREKFHSCPSCLKIIQKGVTEIIPFWQTRPAGTSGQFPAVSCSVPGGALPSIQLFCKLTARDHSSQRTCRRCPGWRR